MHHSRTVWIVCLVLCLLPVRDRRAGAGEAAASAAAERPNIVLILADDQSYRDFGFMGNRQVHTPRLDALAAAGAVYPNGYVPMSVCRPSLATLLTGLYPHQHGIYFNHPPPGLAAMRRLSAAEYQATRAATDPLLEQVPTLPRLLAAHGYACLQTGKHWEGSFRTAGFTQGMTQAAPADRLSPITGTRVQENGEWVAHGNGDAGLVIGRETMQPIYDFIDEHASQRPFFIWYAPFLPHTPFDAPQRFHDLYAGQHLAPELEPYYAEIARFDASVGQLLDHLERRQQTASTLILLVADNGFRPDPRQASRHNQRSKLSAYEDGLRTPFVMRWPQRVVPAIHNALVHTIDVVPTLLSAAGLSEERSPRMLGRDLLPSALGSSPLAPRPVFGAIYPNDARTLHQPAAHVRARWVRDGDWKLILPGRDPQALELQLFNLQQDPAESHNLANAPAHADQQRRLIDLIEQWWPDGDNSRVTLPLE